MTRQLVRVILSVALMLVACADQSVSHIEPFPIDDRSPEMLMAFGVATFEYGRLYGQLAHLYGGHIAGQSMPLIEVRLTDIRGEARHVDVVVEIEGWAKPWRQSVVVSAGRTTWVSASPRLDLARIYRQTEVASAQVAVTVSERGRVLVHQHKSLEIQPIDQFTWFSREGADEPLEDMRPFLATLIRSPDLTQMMGAERDVFAWVKSLYGALRVQDMCCARLNDAYFQKASRVRFMPVHSASVVEGVVWLAGALEAAGVEVALVFLSDHLLLGFWAEGHHHFLDLAIMGSFEQAVDAGNRLFVAGQEDPLFRLMTLRALRQMGIVSIPY